MDSNIQYHVYRPVDYAKGIILILHGMSEHSARYEDFAKFLCQNDYVVITYDHRGHGQDALNAHTLGDFGDHGWLTLVQDARQIANQVKKEYPPNVPFILFGHSMGTIVARSYLKRYDHELNYLILQGAPTFSSATYFGKKLAKLICIIKGNQRKSKLLTRMTTGAFSKTIKQRKTDLDWLSYNEDNVTMYQRDELCGFPFTNRGYYDLLLGMIDMHQFKKNTAKNKNLPILFIGGADDPVIGGLKGLKKSIAILKKAGYVNIHHHLFEKMRHEIIFEDKKQDVYDYILSFLNKSSE